MNGPRSLVVVAIMALATLSAASCALGGGRPPGIAPGLDVVQGTVTYRETATLPADAVLDVRIIDVTPTPGAGITVAEATVPSDGRQVPLPFAIGYDSDKIAEDRSYAVKVTIRGGGKTLFATESNSLVITKGHSRRVELILVPAEGVMPAPAN